MLDRGISAIPDTLIFLVFFAGIGFWAWYAVRKAKKLLALHDGKVDPSALEAALLRQRQKWEWIPSLPLPRQIRMTAGGRRRLVKAISSVALIDALLALTVYGNWWVFHKKYGQLAHKLVQPIFVLCLVLGALVTLFYIYLNVSYHRRARRLLVNGAVGMATVVGQEQSSGRNILVAQLTDGAGQNIRARFIDRLNLCFEHTVVPVFYDPQKPKDTFVILGTDDDYEFFDYALFSLSSRSMPAQR